MLTSLTTEMANLSTNDTISEELERERISIGESELLLPSEGESNLFPIPTSMIIVLFILYGAICITALVGNSLVLGLSMCSRRMRTVTNLFIANLALADIIIGLITIPFQFQAALLQRWDLPHFLCALCPFVQVLCVNVSVFTLSAIAIDRYRAVMYPLKPPASKQSAYWIILSIWIVGLLLAIPTEFDYEVTFTASDDGSNTQKPFCTNVWLSPQLRVYYNQSIVILQYFFPLCIITGVYIRMGTRLWRNQSPGTPVQSRDALILKNKKKVVKMLALVVILFALCWFPLQTYNFVQFIFPSVNTFYYINVLWFSFHLLAMSNSCCNPFVYAIYNEKFRREFNQKVSVLPEALQRCWGKQQTRRTSSTANFYGGNDSHSQTGLGQAALDQSPLQGTRHWRKHDENIQNSRSISCSLTVTRKYCPCKDTSTDESYV